MYGSENCHRQQSYTNREKDREEFSTNSTATTSAKTSDFCAVGKLSITEGFVSAPTESKQIALSAGCSGNCSMRDSLSAAGSEGHLCGYGDDQSEDQEKIGRIPLSVRCHCQPLPAHYGSTSTTFSSESSNLTNSSFGGASGVRQLHHDQSSVASSSGVATMSSTDHLPMIDSAIVGSLSSSAHSPLPSRSSADDSTPTISTLSGGATRLRRELGPLLGGAAYSLASSGSVLSNTAGSVAATAFSSLSLSTPASISSLSTPGPAAADLENKYNLTPMHNADKTTVGVKCDTNGLLVSHSQAHSTPSLIGTGTGASGWRKQLDPATSFPGCNGSFALGENQQSQKEERSTENISLASVVHVKNGWERNGRRRKRIYLTVETSSSSAGMTASGVVLTNPSTSQAGPSTLPGQPLPQLGLTTSPLPSVFNCAATSCSQIICTPLRTIVSQNRRRYQMDGFNLDLTYITDRIIAMGYPADTREALYRNSMSHIVRFLEHYHPGHYKVFNLRGHYVYDPANFHNRVVSYEMTDHHPPRLAFMAPFCREVHDYLEADPKNVVAVHCKAGKGRTGVMICAYLCYISFYRIPRQNMDYYSIIRTHNNKGVTIPSQRRYVYYFSHLRKRKLNYMPLRCELVGVYLERPPKLSGPFSKGALKVRVALGDVDVFLGNELWLDGDKYEVEEELHKRFPLMVGEDQHDPTRPDPHKTCISRRCFGWTVPENRRVFLEGDVRVDIFQKSQLKLFNVKQERKKIGHIWFNTMFTCPGFCGGAYVHGDEAYSYPESMIVRRCHKRLRNQKIDEVQLLKSNHLDSTTTAVVQQPQHRVQEQTEDSNSEKEDTKSREKLVSTSFRLGGLRLNSGVGASAVSGKKRSTRSPCRQLIEAESRSWQSQDGEDRQQKIHQSGARASLDTVANVSGGGIDGSEWVEEIIVERPPGLTAHCSEDSLKRIFPNDKLAPRHGIEEMIREAFHKNLISDSYNTRRISQTRGEGQPIPKAPVGRPNADGPLCLIRKPDEHVSVFGVQEIDRAYKNKDIDAAFKLFIVTRCVDESAEKNVLLAEQHIAATRQKQAQKDKEKSNKMEQKQRKLGPASSAAAHQHVQPASQLDFSSVLADFSHASCSSSSSIAVSSCASSLSSQSQLTSVAAETSSMAHSTCFPTSLELRNSVDDPRLSDPHLRNFFFRQRLSSQSKHPHVHHHCSLRTPDPQVCAKFACNKSAEAITNSTASHRRRNSASGKLLAFCPTTATEVDEEELGGTDDTSFADFDFFHPRQTTCSTMRGDVADVKKERVGRENNNLSASSSVSTITAMTRTKTLSNEERKREDIVHKKQSIANRESFTRKKSCQQLTEKGSVVSSPLSDQTEPEIYHPSDCSLAPSSSSCSSSDSLENQQQPQSSELDSGDNRGRNILQPHNQYNHHTHQHNHRHRNRSSHKSGDSGSRSSRERK